MAGQARGSESSPRLVRARINRDAVITAGINNNETDSGGRAGGLRYMSDVDALVAIEPERHLAESVLANPGDKADSRPQPCARYRLIGTFSTKVHSIAHSEKRLAGAGQALNFHG